MYFASEPFYNRTSTDADNAIRFALILYMYICTIDNNVNDKLVHGEKGAFRLVP